MSPISHYQLRRFTFLFQQYSGTITTEAELESPAASIPPTAAASVATSSVALNTQAPQLRASVSGNYRRLSNVTFAETGPEPPAQTTKSITLDNRLVLREFTLLLSRIGPSVTLEQAADYIYEYDSTLTGTLTFEDFIEFIKDYFVILVQERDRAIAYWNKLEAESQTIPEAFEFVAAYKTLDCYLSSIGLEDAECFFRPSDWLVDSLNAAGQIIDPNILKRRVSVRIFAAYNLRGHGRLKKRAGREISYETLDPFVQVSCAGVSKRTTTKPTWDQDLVLCISIPPGETHDIQQWVQSHNIEFFLFDSNTSGLLPSTDLIAYACIPLLRVLLSSRKPLSAVLKMTTPECNLADPEVPRLEIAVSDQTQERWSWSKVVDVYRSSEEVWEAKYETKMKEDLTRSVLGHSKKSKKVCRTMVESMHNIWSLLLSTQQGLKTLFRHRLFKFVVLDEFNNFRFLPSILSPFDTIDTNLTTPNDLAASVGCIPYKPQVISPSDRSLFYQKKAASTPTAAPHPSPANAAGPGVGGAPSNQHHACRTAEHTDMHSGESANLSAWYYKGNPAAYATETFFGQVASPSSMLLVRAGSVLEHACLLCSLFLGRHMNAFVAIGEVKRRPYVWVVTISPRANAKPPPSTNGNNNNSNNGNTNAGSLNSSYNAGLYASQRHVPSIQDDNRESESSTEELANAKDQKPVLARIKYAIEELDEPFVFERYKFVKLGPVMASEKFKESHQVLHWDPLTGVSFEVGRDTKFPFDRLDTLFNHQNIFFNVQSTNLSTQPTFSWDLDNTDMWVPFFTSDVAIHPGQVSPFYMEPTSIQSYTFEVDPSVMQENLIKELVNLIQLYRRHMLFIPFTTFHRSICSHIQNILTSMDDVRAVGTPSLLSSSQGTGGRYLSAGRRLDKTQGPQSAGVFGSSLTFRQDTDAFDEGIMTRLKSSVVRLLPDRHYWQGSMFQFMDCEAEGILEQLGKDQIACNHAILDGRAGCQHPDVMITIGVRVIQQPFGMFTVRVIIGHVADLLAMDLHKLTR
ncbi:hypothetical protein BC831DRAFT_478987 [Entophlyctis helioformis]|nr:hypothetical protein BC831DRAFT_478987 [Entophlyctis helioformis]